MAVWARRDADARLDEVERRHQVVAEDLVRRVARRLGQRRAVDDHVLAADDGEGVARIGEVGLEVVRAGMAAFIDRWGEVAAGHAVPGFDQIVDRGGADLPARPGDEDLHTALLPRCSDAAPAAQPALPISRGMEGCAVFRFCSPPPRH